MAAPLLERASFDPTRRSDLTSVIETARVVTPLNWETMLPRWIDLLLAQIAKRGGLVEKPLPKPRPSRRDHIPAHVKREIWKRDSGRCAFVLASGEVCGSTHGSSSTT